VPRNGPCGERGYERPPGWSFTLDSGATKNLDIALRLPAGTGSFTANISIDSTRNDLATPSAPLSTLSVESADQVAPRVGGGARSASRLLERQVRSRRAISLIQRGTGVACRRRRRRAIDQLVEAAERLMKIASVDVSAQRVEVDRLLQEAQVRWFLAQPQ